MGIAEPDPLATAWRHQRPGAGELVIDHLGHFVPDADAGAEALERLGFSVPPFSVHQQRVNPASALTPAGTGNRCVMLERGYLEFLSPTADGRELPNAREVLAAARRYVGVHLIAFGTADPQVDFLRLAAQGFQPMPIVDLQRPVATPQGEETARFSVVRVPEGVMQEGRVQFCEQRAPELIWQPRWMRHANGARTLEQVLICAEDPRAAVSRFGRFAGLRARPFAAGFRLTFSRGEILFVDRQIAESWLDERAPDLPWIAAYALGVDDIGASRDFFVASGLPLRDLGTGRFAVTAPAAVGGVIVFQTLQENCKAAA